MALRTRDRVGLNVPPLFLRFMLGVIFVYAGLGKVSQTADVSGDAAVVLANMGVITAAPSGEKPAPSKAPEPKVPETKPSEAKPPEPKPPAAPAAKPGASRPRSEAGIVTVRFQSGVKVLTAADFPNPVPVRQVYLIALSLHELGKAESGKMPLWPPSLSGGTMPVYLAWAVAVTELGGGVCLLLGLLTRLSALGIAGVMLGAMWLTEIGPAIQKGGARWGFLPTRPAFDPGWQMLMLQFALFAAAMALAFCGPGRLSLDTLLLTGRDEDDDEE